MKKLGSILQYVRAHKIISIVVIVVLLGGGYYWYSVATVAPTVTKYVVENATTGTIVSSVSATGQVQAGTTINVTPKVSEDVTSIPVTVGEHVYAGQVVLQLDPTNEQRSLNQAQLSLEQAQLSCSSLDVERESGPLKDLGSRGGHAAESRHENLRSVQVAGCAVLDRWRSEEA